MNQLICSSSFLSLLELLLLLLVGAVRIEFEVPFCLGCVGFSDGIPASFLVGVGVFVMAPDSVGVGGIVEVAFSAESMDPCTDPSSAISIKHPPMIRTFFLLSISIPLVCGVRSGSILLLLVDEGGMGISWSVGNTENEMEIS